MNVWRTAARLLPLALLLAACGDDGGPAEGSELGPCVDGLCLGSLVCAPENVCVDPAQLGSDTEATAQSSSGANSGEESMTSAADSGPDESTGGAADEGGADEGGAADEGGDDEGGAADEGGADEGGADGGGADDGGAGDSGSDIPAACVQFGSTYCSCLGEIAAPDCVSGATESCADTYDLCPSYWTCINNDLSSCDLDNSECKCG